MEPIILGMVFALCMTVPWMHGWLCDWEKARAKRPKNAQPIVHLVCDMLAVDHGWKHTGYKRWEHETGIKLEAQLPFTVSLRVDDAPVQLNPADIELLRMAVTKKEERKEKADSEQAARVLAERAHAFAIKAEAYANQMAEKPL